MADLNPQIPLASSFEPVSLAEGAQRGLRLQQGQLQLQQEQMRTADLQSTQQDKQYMQDYLRSGGDLYSEEGIKKAAETLKGKVSPGMYMKLNEYGTTFKQQQAETASKLAALDEAKFKQLNNITDIAYTTLQRPLQAYDQSWRKILKDKNIQVDPDKNPNNPEVVAAKKEAEPVFKAAQLANTQFMTQQFGGQIPPMYQSIINDVGQMDPGAATAAYNATQHSRKIQAEVAKQKLETAQARRAEVSADIAESGGPAAAAYEAMVAAYGEDSPQAKAALMKLQGGAGSMRFAPVDTTTQKGQDAVEAATWDLIMKGSKPSAIGGMQQAVYARLTEIGRANNMEPGDVLAASADFKSRMLAKAQLERRIQNTQRAENQIIAELPVMKAAMANLSLPSIPLAARGKIAVLRQLGDPNVTRLDQSAEAILNEFQSIMTGNPGALNVADVEHARQQYKTIQTPQQMAAWIDQAENMIKRAKAAGVKTREEVMGEARAILPGGKKGEKERGADDLETLIKQMETALADTKPGTGSYDRIKKDLDEARGELAKLKPGAAAAPAAPASAPAKAGPPKLNSFNDLKRLVSEGKLKKGDEFIGPDGKSYTVKKIPE